MTGAMVRLHPMSLLTQLLTLTPLLSLVRGETQTQAFRAQPGDVTVQAGDKVVLPCVVTNKVGVLQWTKDGFGLGVQRELPGFPRYSMVGDEEAGDFSLEIAGLAPEDDAVFQCQVSAAGEVAAIRSSPAQVSVMSTPGHPVILTHQGGHDGTVEIIEGHTLELQCITSGGRPAGEIVWKYENGNEILSNTNTKTVKIPRTKTFETVSQLKLPAGPADDQKVILCEVFNHLLTTPRIASIKLQLKSRPRVLLDYDHKILEEGEMFSARCEASAFPRVTSIAWFLDNKALEELKGEEMELRVTRAMNNKRLECRASNDVGTTAANTTLHIKYGPILSQEPKSLRVREGTSARFSCVAEGNPQPRYAWVKISGGREELVADTGDLVLVGSGHTVGEYQCLASVGEREVRSQGVSLGLYTRPVILATKTQYGEEGENVVLTCRIESGLEDNKIFWDKEGRPVTPDPGQLDIRVTDTGTEYISELVIARASAEDFVSYGCRATNSMGYDYVRINLSKKEEIDSELWYVIISVLALLIILSLLGLCFLLGRRREKSNLELIKDANEREKVKENEYVKEQFGATPAHEIRGPGPDLIPIVKKGKQLPRNLLSPMEDFTDDEDDGDRGYKISPIDDEESHIYAKIGAPASFMMQRFQQQPFPSNPSISSIESNGSQNLSSLDSANSFMNKMRMKEEMKMKKQPFVIKNVYVKPPEERHVVKQTKFMLNTDQEESDEDDQYVTLLPTKPLPPV